MKHNLLILTSMLLVSTSIANAAPTGNVNFLLGRKALNEDDWGTLDKQTELGVLVDFRGGEWPVNLAIDTLVSVDTINESGVEVTGSTVEINAGVRKYFETGVSIKPYIAGGLALISAEIEASYGGITVSEDDNGFGYWLNGGVVWTVNQVNFGLDLRYSDAKVTLSGIEGEAGGSHVGVFAGYHW